MKQNITEKEKNPSENILSILFLTSTYISSSFEDFIFPLTIINNKK